MLDSDYDLGIHVTAECRQGNASGFSLDVFSDPCAIGLCRIHSDEYFHAQVFAMALWVAFSGSRSIVRIGVIQVSHRRSEISDVESFNLMWTWTSYNAFACPPRRMPSVAILKL